MQTRRLHQLGQGANENGRVDESDDRLWVVDTGGGQLRVVQGREALKALIASHDLPSSARAYELSAVPKTLGEIPDVAAAYETSAPALAPAPVVEEVAMALVHEALAPTPVVEEVAVAPVHEAPALAPTPVVEEVAVAPVHEAPAPAKTDVEVTASAAPPEIVPAAPVAAPTRSGSRDAEFSLLDRPFDDADYFEDPPRARWPRVAGVVVGVASLVGIGYRLTTSRQGARAPAAPVVQAATVIAATASPAPTQAPPIPTPAPTAASPGPAPAPTAASPEPAPAPTQAPPTPAAAPVAALVPAQVEQRLADPSAAPEPSGVPSPSYSALVAEGRRSFDAGHGRKAQALFEQALTEQPDGVEALVGLAYAQLDRGKMQEAIGSFKKALDQDGGHSRAVFGLAESYRQQGNRAAALATFKRFLKLQPTGPDADIARRLVEELNAGG